jgi:hypothetical protein
MMRLVFLASLALAFALDRAGHTPGEVFRLGLGLLMLAFLGLPLALWLVAPLLPN